MLTGLLVSLILIGMVAVFAIDVVPTYKYTSARRAIASARAAGNTPQEIRNAFDRQAELGYVKSVTGADFDLTNARGTYEVSFAYRKTIHMDANVSLQMDYATSTAVGRTTLPKVP